MELNWKLQRGGLRKNPFHGGGMDDFWNHTFREQSSRKTVSYKDIFVHIFVAIQQLLC